MSFDLISFVLIKFHIILFSKVVNSVTAMDMEMLRRVYVMLSLVSVTAFTILMASTVSSVLRDIMVNLGTYSNLSY